MTNYITLPSVKIAFELATYEDLKKAYHYIYLVWPELSDDERHRLIARYIELINSKLESDRVIMILNKNGRTRDKLASAITGLTPRSFTENIQEAFWSYRGVPLNNPAYMKELFKIVEDDEELLVSIKRRLVEAYRGRIQSMKEQIEKLKSLI